MHYVDFVGFCQLSDDTKPTPGTEHPIAHPLITGVPDDQILTKPDQSALYQ